MLWLIFSLSAAVLAGMAIERYGGKWIAGKTTIAKQELVATKAELVAWKLRLEATVYADERSARAAIANTLKEITAKI